MMVALVIVAAAAAGILETLSLRRSARQGAGPFTAALRLLLVAAALTGAALSGHLLAGAAGWAGGFGLSALAVAWRWS